MNINIEWLHRAKQAGKALSVLLLAGVEVDDGE